MTQFRNYTYNILFLQNSAVLRTFIVVGDLVSLNVKINEISKPLFR